MRLLLALVLAVAGCVVVDATVTVAFLVPGQRIVFGADEAMTAGDGTVTGGSCKIRLVKRWAVMNAGLSRVGELNVLDAVTHAIERTTTMDAALRAIESTYRQRLEPALAGLAGTPGFDLLFSTAGAPIVQLRVGGMDHGVLTVGAFVVNLVSRRPFRTAMRRATCPGDVCDPDGRLIDSAAAAAEPVVALTSRMPYPAWLDRADAAAALRLLRMQADATPARVRAPFDVLEIDRSGAARWVGWVLDSACAAVP
jgi:hypothetical protein